MSPPGGVLTASASHSLKSSVWQQADIFRPSVNLADVDFALYARCLNGWTHPCRVRAASALQCGRAQTSEAPRSALRRKVERGFKVRSREAIHLSPLSHERDVLFAQLQCIIVISKSL